MALFVQSERPTGCRSSETARDRRSGGQSTDLPHGLSCRRWWGTVSLDLDDLIRLVDETVDPGPDDAAVSYNAACFYALASEIVESDDERRDLRRRSLDLLFRARHANNGTEVSELWVRRDPDLAALRKGRGVGRYDEFRALVRSYEEQAEANPALEQEAQRLRTTPGYL